MTFKAYMDNVEAETGKMPVDFWKLVRKKGFVKKGKIVAKHTDLLAWLKPDIGLGMCVRTSSSCIYACAQMTQSSALNRRSGSIALDIKNGNNINFRNFFY
jgi:hypothetical protein